MIYSLLDYRETHYGTLNKNLNPTSWIPPTPSGAAKCIMQLIGVLRLASWS